MAINCQSFFLFLRFSKIEALFDWFCFDYKGCKTREIYEGSQKATSFLYETAFKNSNLGRENNLVIREIKYIYEPARTGEGVLFV